MTPFLFERKMKRIHLLNLLFSLLALSACQLNSKKAEVAIEEHSMALSKEDTITVTSLVDQFMSYAKNQQFDEAVAMLYEKDAMKPEQEPQLLSNEGMQQAKAMLQIFPVQRYEINQIIFKEAENNEVKCTIYFSKTGKTNWYFKPVRYLGHWMLCMRDTNMGDKTIEK